MLPAPKFPSHDHGGESARFEGEVVITSPEGKLEVQDTTNNYQVTLVPAAIPRISFGTIGTPSQYMVIDGGNTNRIVALNDFFIGTASVNSASFGKGFYYDISEERFGIHTNAPTHDFTVNGDISASANVSASAFYFGPGGRQIISDTGTDMSILASTTGMFISADGGNLTLQNNVAIDTAGVISSSQNISGSGLYAKDVYISSIPDVNRVLVSTTNGQITSHSPFTFASDVLSVPTITASVGIEVTSSANGSINIGQGIRYTFGGKDLLDVFEGEFKLRSTDYHQAISQVQTSNFNIDRAVG